jgi:pimeloyl-ACP methyl ester carboxylesterase
MSSSPARLLVPEGPGSASGAPDLPAAFGGVFASRYVDTADLRQHVVTGGEGPPLLLVHGWPETWYAWRLVMPGLARGFTVVAPDQRGCGLSGKPASGYDTGTLAADLVALMDALGHQWFAVAGHDTGMWIGYALAADHPGRVVRLAVAEAAMPGVSPSPPLFGSTPANDRLWHFAFNRLAEVNEQLIADREDIYFGSQFAKAARKLPGHVVRHYVDALAADPDALSGSFAAYRALDDTIAQNEQRRQRRLTLPVLAIGGAEGIGEGAATTMRLAADDVRSVVISGSGHYCLEEAPGEVLAALTEFLAPYRDESAGVPVAGPRIAME